MELKGMQSSNLLSAILMVKMTARLDTGAKDLLLAHYYLFVYKSSLVDCCVCCEIF